MKKRCVKRGISLLLAMIMMLSMLPLTAISSFAAEQYTMDQLKSMFPSGKYWTHKSSSSWNVKTVSSYPAGSNGYVGNYQPDGSSQCHGFACVLAEYYSGTTSKISRYNKGSSGCSVDNIRVGDKLRIDVNGNGVNDDNYDHTVFVTAVSSTEITIAECNWACSGGNLINWGRKISKSSLKTSMLYLDHYKQPTSTSSTSTSSSSSNTTSGDEGWYRPLKKDVWKVSTNGWYGGSHKGIDLCPAYGTPIYATRSGKVVKTYDTTENTGPTGNYKECGVSVNINHGNYLSTYMHMSKRVVYEGQTVTQGQLIGYVGNSGYSTGTHLHFGVCKANSNTIYFDKSSAINVNPDSFNYKDTLKIDPPKDAPKNLKATGGVTYSDSKIAVGKTLNFSWSGVSGATQYVVKLNGSIVKSDLTSTSYSVTLNKLGTNTIEVAGKNSAGTGPFAKFTCETMPKVPVNFYDDEGVLIETKEIDWNSTPSAPANIPQKEHYLFAGWSPALSTVAPPKEPAENYKQDFTANYEKVKYNVRFFAYNADGETVQIGSTQKVKYLESATAPTNYLSYIRSGMEFAGWSTDFSSIEGNTDVYLIEKWYNENMKIQILDGATAVRDPDGYTVNCTLQNNYDSKTVGRVIVAIKTAEGKLIYTTESAAFTIKAGQSKAMEIYVPCAEMGTTAEIYAVEKYTTALPISLSKHVVVDQGNAFSNWSTDAPPANAIATQTKTQYRYRDKEFKTSGYSSLAGYTRVGDKQYIDTVSYGSFYANKENCKPQNSVDNNYYYEESIVSSTKHRSIAYYQSDKKYYNSVYTSNYCYLLEVYSQLTPTYNNSDSSGKFILTNMNGTGIINKWSSYSGFGKIEAIRDKGSDVNQFVTGANNKLIALYNGNDVKIHQIVKKRYQYSHYKWGDWSEWSDDVITANDNRQVETQTLYRYKTNDTTNLENTDGALRTISGKVDVGLAGREADLFIYKYNEASDWTNQYIGQCTIGDDGSYSFTFKLRTEPSLTTGDYTATLGIEGTSAVIDLTSEYEWLKAPLPTHNVTYYNTDGSIISTQTVVEGQNAVVPDVIPEREGYTFVGWSESNINVTEDLIVSPEMKINTYTVTFIDWENKKYEVRTFSHGDELTAPEIENIEEGYIAGWDALINGTRTVTENMVVCSVYEKMEFTVNFYDYNNELLSTQSVKYGEAAELPELDDTDIITFKNWSTDECFNVKSDLDIYPVFEYDTTVETPTASYDTGIYSENINVTLSCPTDGAKIYYSTNGSNPLETGLEYIGPIEIKLSTQLEFIAVKENCNNSELVKRYYALNKDDMTSEWMTFENLPDDVVQDPVFYSLQAETGYKYKNIISTDSLSYARTLRATGWTELDSEWTEYSDYFDVYPELPDSEIEIVSKEADPVETKVYNYSHYKYLDTSSGNYVFVNEPVENTDGITESIKLTTALKVNSFVNGKAAYSYNGELWFKLPDTIELVSPGYDVYSYRTKVFNFYKWSDWTIAAPSMSETRETISSDVFSYQLPNEYIVSIDFSNSEVSELRNNEQMLVKEGKTIQLIDNYFDVVGYTFDGVFTDFAYNNEWDINAYSVNGNVTLYPKYTLNTFTVKFIDYDDSVISQQNVQYLNYADVPSDPTRDGYVFINWQCIEGEQSDGVIGNVTYKAVYVPEDEYTIVSLSRSKLSIMTGSTASIRVTLSSVNSNDSDVIWYSSNPEIATVDEFGNIKGIHSGTAVITAVAMDTYESANCVVTVLGTADTEILPISNSGVRVDPSTKYLLGIDATNNTVNSINDCLQNKGLIYTNFDASISISDFNLHIGTGSKIFLKDGDFEVDEVVLVVKGDVNGDGAVDAFDMFYLDKCINSLISLSGEFEAAADFTDDGLITIEDYSNMMLNIHKNL